MAAGSRNADEGDPGGRYRSPALVESKRIWEGQAFSVVAPSDIALFSAVAADPAKSSVILSSFTNVDLSTVRSCSWICALGSIVQHSSAAMAAVRTWKTGEFRSEAAVMILIFPVQSVSNVSLVSLSRR